MPQSSSAAPIVWCGRGVRPFPFSVPREGMERTRSRVYPRSARLIAQVGYTGLAIAPEGWRDPLGRSLAIGPAGEAGEASPAPVGVGTAPPGAPPGLAGAYV